MLDDIRKRAQQWLSPGYDEETRKKVTWLLENDEKELQEAFYRDLEFGTGGLRGIMGVGTNRMNKYTVGIATQGLANYLKKTFPAATQLRVAIAYDCRNNSDFFSQVTAEILSANGIMVFLFEKLRPLPELSFAIRHLNCQSGVVITASHNPKEYNGYKVFWEDGGQIVPPHDKNIIDEAMNIASIDEVKFEGDKSRITMIGKEIDAAYFEQLKALSLAPDAIQRHKSLKIIYTPLHGSGVMLVPQALANLGFDNLIDIPEQNKVDGNFPTVEYPNPEEPSVFKMALEKARAIDADLIMATDPDADRTAVVVKNNTGDYTILSGNETAALLSYYLLHQWKEKGRLKGNEYIVKTIVTSEMLCEIARDFGAGCFDVLTGFKWIADIIRRNEGKKTFIGGGEESIGFLIGDFRRDKDGVSTCAMVAEVAAWAADNGMTLYELLIDLFRKYGHYRNHLVSLVKKGMDGAAQIQQMMVEYRSQPPGNINGLKVVRMRDYQELTERDTNSGEVRPIDFPKSNVLQFFLEDGSKISVRPSGTEPKIKFYFEVRAELPGKAAFIENEHLLERKIDGIVKAMGLA